MKFLGTLAAAALCGLTVAAPAPIENSIAARAAPVDPVTDGDLAENAIVWLIAAYSDEAEGVDKLDKRANGGDLPDEDLNRSSDIILLLVKAYSDEVEGADKLDKRELARRAVKSKRAMTPEQMATAKRAIVNKLNA